MNLPSATNSSPAPAASRWLTVCFAIVAFIGIWPALTNGQPFFFPDTTAYVRGADLAITKVFGNRLATDWAKDHRRTVEAETEKSGFERAESPQKPVQRPVLAGRSIIYGALLYLGAFTGGMWLSVFVQSLIAVYLTHLFVARTLGLDFRSFLVSCVVLFTASSLPFYLSLLMPDVFAGLLILAFSILATSWERLSNFERATVSFILLFAVLAHATHVILLAVLTALTVAYVRLLSCPQWARVRPLIAVGTACLLIAFVWEAAFAFAVKRALGTPPVRPPFLTAKLVSMLGEPAVAAACASNDFAVCKFQDRFPLDVDSFMWAEDKRTGVFSTVDLQTKQALSGEQLRFAIAVVPPNFGRVVSGVFRDGLRQLAAIGLDEYSYGSGMLFFKDRLPTRDFATMTSTVAARSHIYVVFGNVSYLTGALGALAMAALLGAALRSRETRERQAEPESAWRAAVSILLAGIILNAFICGGLSSVNSRYQARVIWLLPLSAATGLFVIRRASMRSTMANAAIEKSATAPS